MAQPTAEEQILAAAILRHRPLSLANALHAALRVAGEWVPEEEAPLLRAYADSISIDMDLEAYRYVSRDEAGRNFAKCAATLLITPPRRNPVWCSFMPGGTG